MAPAKPTNFKTYEAQARLLAATLAAHPEFKPNYKEIAKNYGSTQSASAVEHRFRPLRKAAEAMRTMVRKKQDPAMIEDILDENVVDIAQHFGGSTPDGIQFQFRQIKANSEALRNAVKNGEDPVEAFANSNGVPKNALPMGAASGSRKRSRAPATPKTKAGGSAGASASRTKSNRKTAKAVKYQEEDEEDDGSSNVDYSELDLSPTKLTKKIKTTPAKFSKAPKTTAMANETAPATAPAPADNGDDEVIFMKEEFVKEDLLPTRSAPQLQSSSGTRESGGNSSLAANDYTSQPQGGYASGFASLVGASSYRYDHSHSYGGQSNEFSAYLEAQLGQGYATHHTTDFEEEMFANASDDDHGAI